MTDNEIKTDATEGNILPFLKPKTIGAGTTDNWLIKLEIGTRFLSRNKGNTAAFELMKFEVLNKIDDYVFLEFTQGPADIEIWVDSQRFSNQMELNKVLNPQGN